RGGSIPQVMAALRNTAIGLLRWAGHTNIAAACRQLAAQPAQALALIRDCIRKLNDPGRRGECLAGTVGVNQRGLPGDDPVIAQVRQLFTRRGIGVNSAWLYVMEFCAWRDFQTPKQVGALAGLTPTPYQSG